MRHPTYLSSYAGWPPNDYTRGYFEVANNSDMDSLCALRLAFCASRRVALHDYRASPCTTTAPIIA